MGPVIRWLLKVFSVFIGLFAFLAQVGPNALKSNISEWLGSFGVADIPQKLVSPGISLFFILLAIVLVLFPFAPWIYRQLKKLVWPLQVENFQASDPTDLKYTVGVKVTNTTGARLNHCTVRIENIEPSEPDSLFWIFSDSQLRLKPAEEEVFALNPHDHRGVFIAQYDSVNRFEKLGIELLCFSNQRHQAVDPRQSYIITITASAERGFPLQKQYKLWLDAAERLCFEPADALCKDRKRILAILRRMVERVIRPKVRTS